MSKVKDDLRAVFGRIEERIKSLVATNEEQAKQIARMERRLKIGAQMGDDYLDGVESEDRGDGTGLKGFSIARAIYAQQTGNWKQAGLEKEALDTIKRDMELSDDESIGFIVPPTVVMQIIPLLRSMMIVDALGVTRMDGLTGSRVDQPRETGDGEGYWIGENPTNGITASDATTDLMSLIPRTAAGLRKFSLKLLAAGTPQVESFVRNGLAQRLARTIQKAFFEGTGSSAQPQGVFNHPNINSVTMGAITLTKLQQMVEELEADNNNGQNFKWAMNPRAKHKIRQLTADGAPVLKRKDGSPGADANADTIEGFEVHTTTDIAITDASPDTTDIALADWSMTVLAEWNTMEIVSSGSAGDAFENRMLWVRAVQDVDVGMMHEESLVIGDNAQVNG